MPYFRTHECQPECYTVFLKQEIGPILNQQDAEIIVEFLNRTRLFQINRYSFFSYESIDNESNKESYQIYDRNQKIGDEIDSRRNVVSIVTWLNTCTEKLKEIIDTCSYEPIIGDEPTDEEIKYYMTREKVGYYIAKEKLRLIKYKKLNK